MVGTSEPGPCRFDGRAAGAELTEHERALNDVEQEFSRMVVGARQGVLDRTALLDPSLLPFDFKTLNALWHHAVRVPDTPSMTSSDLRDLLATDKSMVSRSVKRLEECGFLSRDTDPEDARVQLLSITRTGYERFKKVAVESPSTVSSRLKQWDLDSLDQLAGLLHRINGPLPDQEEEA